MSRIYAIIFAVLFALPVLAQLPMAPKKWHRAFPLSVTKTDTFPDSLYIVLDGIEGNDGNYYTLAGVQAVTKNAYSYMVVKQMDAKGEINWSKKIEVDKVEFEKGIGQIVHAKNDSLFITMTATSGSKRNFMAYISTGGAKLNVIQYGNLGVEANGLFKTNLVVNSAKDTLLRQLITNTYTSGTTTNILNDFVTYDKDIKLSNVKRYSVQSLNTTVDRRYQYNDYTSGKFGNIAGGKLTTTNDTTFTGLLTAFNRNDSTIWTKSYSPQGIGTVNKFNIQEVANLNSQFIVVGQANVVSGKYNNPAIIMRVDSLGRVVWTKTIDTVFSRKVFINGLSVNGPITTVTGHADFQNKGVIYPFMLLLDINGNQTACKLYPRSKGYESRDGDVKFTKDGGNFYVTSDVERQRLLKPSIIKTDDKGVTGCEQNVTTQITSALTMAVDSLKSITTVIEGRIDKVTGKADDYSNFIFPKFSLNVRPFCPNEKIDWTFNAKIAGGIKWLWSDKSTADTLRVFKTGEYTVEVTMDTHYCYTICDTAMLETTDLPKVIVGPGPKVCRNAEFRVEAIPMAESQVANWAWSNGSTNPGFITSSTLGSYSVTITDKCGDKANATINITDAIYFPSPGGNQLPPERVCRNAPFVLAVAGAGGGGGPYTFVWSTSATTPTITTSALGPYSVTVTDVCKQTGVVNFNVNENVYFPAPTGAVAKGPVVCKNANFILSSAGSGGGGAPYTYRWSSGETTDIINKNGLGNYVVTVTDKCMQTGTASINVGDNAFFGPPTVAIETSPTNNFCNTGSLGLIANVSSPSGTNGIKYSWSTGETTATASVKSNGNYTLTVTDICGNTSTAAVIVDDAQAGSDCIQLPKIFMPGASTNMSPENDFFNGISKCGSSDVSTYELNVYNRWGQLVWSGEKLEDKWDGTTTNGDLAPADVYVWHLKYKVGQFCETDKKGDINLYR
jgi:gliding motility-associated-like protein